MRVVWYGVPSINYNDASQIGTKDNVILRQIVIRPGIELGTIPTLQEL